MVHFYVISTIFLVFYKPIRTVVQSTGVRIGLTGSQWNSNQTTTNHLISKHGKYVLYRFGLVMQLAALYRWRGGQFQGWNCLTLAKEVLVSAKWFLELLSVIRYIRLISMYRRKRISNKQDMCGPTEIQRRLAPSSPLAPWWVGIRIH